MASSRTAGSEGVGIIEEPGEGAGLPAGTRVCFWHGYRAAGSWAEYLVLPELECFTISADLPAELAAQACLNPLTMMGIMELFGDVKQGDWVLQNAANSTCGKYLMQYLKVKGIKTINVVRDGSQVEALKDLGATEVIATDTQDLKERVQEITQRNGVKYAVDCIWGPKLDDYIGILATKGTLVCYGLLSGTEAKASIFPFILGLVTMKGFAIDTWAQLQEKAKLQELVDTSARFLASGEIRLPSRSYSPESFLEAIVASETASNSCKVVLMVGAGS